MRNLGKKNEERDPKHKFFYTPSSNRRYKNTKLSWTFDAVENIDKICDFNDYERLI